MGDDRPFIEARVLKLRKSTRRVLSSHYSLTLICITVPLLNRQMQTQPVVQQPQPVKIYNAVYSSVQVRV
jgi:hypothetical protein